MGLFQQRLAERRRQQHGAAETLEQQFFPAPAKPKTFTQAPPREQARKNKRQNSTVYHLRCAVCDEPFTAKRPEARYCSNRCSGRAERSRKATPRTVKPKPEKHGIRDFTCVVCETPFKSGMPWAKYCSRSCRDKSPAAKLKTVKRDLDQLICLHCESTFTPYDPHQIYCSQRCREHAANRRQWQRVKFVPEERVCKGCGETYTATHRTRKHCSDKCQISWKNRTARARKRTAKGGDA